MHDVFFFSAYIDVILYYIILYYYLQYKIRVKKKKNRWYFNPSFIVLYTCVYKFTIEKLNKKNTKLFRKKYSNFSAFIKYK